jgi:hemin uptake protein HemP
MIKKILILVAVLAFTVTLSACKKEKENPYKLSNDFESYQESHKATLAGSEIDYIYEHFIYEDMQIITTNDLINGDQRVRIFMDGMMYIYYKTGGEWVQFYSAEAEFYANPLFEFHEEWFFYDLHVDRYYLNGESIEDYEAYLHSRELLVTNNGNIVSAEVKLADDGNIETIRIIRNDIPYTLESTFSLINKIELNLPESIKLELGIED